MDRIISLPQHDAGFSVSKIRGQAPTITVEDIVKLLVSLIDGLMLATATEPSNSAEHEHRVQLLREAAQRLLRMGEGRPSPRT